MCYDSRQLVNAVAIALAREGKPERDAKRLVCSQLESDKLEVQRLLSNEFCAFCTYENTTAR